MRNKDKYKLLTYFMAGIWMVNGLYCKVLNSVPRHQEIVARILHGSHPRLLTFLIGLAETGMAVWILSCVQRRLNAAIQILLIAIMNILEFFLAPDLLLWGKYNAVFAFALILLIGYNEYNLNKISIQHKVCSPS